MTSVDYAILINQVQKQLQAEITENFEKRDSRRLFHGRGCCYPGFEQVTVDLFWPVMLVTCFKSPPSDRFEAELISQLQPQAEAAGLSALLVQRRYLEGAPFQCAWGELPAETFARRQGSRFAIQFSQRQNIGFFLDMEPGRRWLEARAAGKKVLNLFAYTCAFSVVAQRAGAAAVVNVDMSRSALSQGRENHRINHLPTDSIQFLPQNILKSWGRIKRPGPYDLAIIDPPTYQPGSFVAERDYGKLVRRIPELMKPGGELLLCLNSPQLGEEFVRQLVAQECPECLLQERLEPCADFPDRDPEQQLKLFSYRYL